MWQESVTSLKAFSPHKQPNGLLRHGFLQSVDRFEMWAIAPASPEATVRMSRSHSKGLDQITHIRGPVARRGRGGLWDVYV